MRWRWHSSAVLGFLFAMHTAAPLSGVPDDLSTIRDIKRKMAHNLERIPNYTCLETMTRSRRPAKSLIVAAHGKAIPFLRVDVVRLEVAQVRGDELYTRAGDHVFRTRNIEELASPGLIGNGVFSLFLHDVFATNIAHFETRTEEGLSKRDVPRYDFRVASLVSGFIIATDLGQGVAGYHGSFYTDPRTVDSLRLEVESEDTPVYTGLKTVSISVDYSTVKIGSSEVLLPQSAEMTAERDNGWASRNRIAFTHCREYGVETSISFEEADHSGGETTVAVDLPPDLELAIRLMTPVDTRTARVGDTILARVDADVKRRGAVVVPTGALVQGRIRSIARHKQQGSAWVVVGLEFMEIEYPGKSARFFATLRRVEVSVGGRFRVVPTEEVLPGVGEVSCAADRLVLPAGAKMLWKTSSY